MKKVVLISVILFFSQSVFTQTKIDEFGRLSYDNVSARLYNAYQNIKDNPTQKAYFIIHKPKNLPLGNFARYFYGIKSFWSDFLKYPSEKIEIAVGEDKEEIFTEVWRISDNSPILSKKIISLEDRLREKIIEKTLFDLDCIDCMADPPIPLSIFYGDGLNFYAEALKANPQTQGLILMRKNYRIKEMREKLVNDYGIEPTRIKFQIKKSLPITSDAKFYIVPV